MSPHLLALGFTLLHFCWQAALIAGVYKTAEVLLPDLKPNRRYQLALAALLTMLVAAVLTFGYEEIRLSQEIVIAIDTLPARDAPVPAPLVGDDISLHALLPWLDMVWLAGVLALTLRMAGGLWQIHSLSKAATEVPEALLRRFTEALQKTGLSNRVQVRLHPGITGPFVVGVLRAVVYLPFSAVTHLSPSQLDAILAHELEHIRRFDYLWNLVQTLVETLFFYHPAVWWLGRTLREQRELCCDDAALKACTDPLTYATALLRLEEQRPRAVSLASGLVMALNGQGEGSGLLSRITRMLGEAPAKVPAGRYNPLVAVPLILLSLSGFVAPVAQVAASTPAMAAIPKFVASVMPVAAPAPVAPEAIKAKAEKEDIKAAIKAAKAAAKDAATWNGSWDQEAYQTAYQQAMNEAAQTRLEAQIEAQQARDEALREAQQEAAQAREEARQEAEQARDEALREADQARREAEREQRQAVREAQREADAQMREQANLSRQKADEARIDAETQRLRAESMMKAAERMAASAQEMAARAEMLRVKAMNMIAPLPPVSPSPPARLAPLTPPAPPAPPKSLKPLTAPVPPVPPTPAAYGAKAEAYGMKVVKVKAITPVVIRNINPSPSPTPTPDPRPNVKTEIRTEISTDVRVVKSDDKVTTAQ
jgi:beta-lactamase regulating signal transducer with metallopeptidase domain